MNMIRRMILIFFLMILLIVIINTYYLSITNIAGADEFSADRFRNMAVSMVHNSEQYFTMMDLAIEDLVSDFDFTNAFYQIAEHGDEDPVAAQAWQNKMSYTLYHSAIAENFYRVSIFCENGFYLSNHIDRNDSLVSMSEEAQEIIAGIPYLADVKETPYLRHVIAPIPTISPWARRPWFSAPSRASPCTESMWAISRFRRMPRSWRPCFSPTAPL